MWCVCFINLEQQLHLVSNCYNNKNNKRIITIQRYLYLLKHSLNIIDGIIASLNLTFLSICIVVVADKIAAILYVAYHL